MTDQQPESQQDRTARLALAAGRGNLIAQAAREHVADHPGGCDCLLCTALARYQPEKGDA